MDQPNTEISGRRSVRGSRETLFARAADEPDLSWRVLATLNIFRILIATALLAVFLVGGETLPFGNRSPTLFTVTASAYLALGLAAAFTLKQRWAPVNMQAIATMLIDTVAVSILMFASDGMSSGLGGLLVVFVGAGGLALPLGLPPIIAAVATFAILGEEVLSGFAGFDTNYLAAGLLCAIIFAMALAVRPLARRIQLSEALARQRGVDLQNLSELNEYIVQHLRESILVIDDDDRIRLGNASASELLGVNGPIRGMALAKAAEPLADYVRRWRQDGSMSAHPEITVATAGHSLRINAHLAPLGKDGDRSGPALVFLEDASLINARVQQSKLASLGRLSASIAHEIRNPVGAMSHAAQLLGESQGLTEDDKRLTEIIQTHSGRVSHIIDNVLQLSRRDSSRPERLQLKPWLEEFVQEFSRTLELQEGQLTLDSIPVDVDVRMDRGHLRQVMWNLCDNAIKYASETGGILVEINAGRLTAQGRPYLEVCDLGHGIDPTIADKIFEPFYTERAGGTGLGLYISRELCELNRSTLLYLDRPGGGSIFRIVFTDPDRWDAADT